jgi:hypothetical protein
MGKKSQNKRKGNKSKKQQMVTISGPWGSKLSFPVPRIPIKIGSADKLSSANSIYPHKVNLDVPIAPFQANIVDGAIAFSQNVDITLVSSFSTRFATLFREYAIVGARFEIRLLNTAVPGGVLKVFLDEKSSGAPGAATAEQNPGLDILNINTESPSRYLIEWKPSDLLDLDWVLTATTYQPVYLKFYTDAGNFFTNAGSAAQVTITGSLALTFRGYL